MKIFYYQHIGQLKLLEFILVDLICSFLIFMNFKKRKYWYVSLTVGLSLIIGLYFLILFVFPNNLYYFLLYYLLICALMYGIYDIPWFAAFYYTCAGWLLQHLMDNVVLIVDQYFTKILQGQDLKIYRLLINTIIKSYIFYTIGIVLFYFFSKHLKPKDEYDFKELSVPLLIINIGGLSIAFFLSNKRFSDYSKWIPYYASLCCLLLLIIMFYVNKINAKRSENLILQNLLEKEKRQYKLAQQSNEQLNIKYHDLKKNIKNLEAQGVDKEYINEIKKSIKSFHTLIKTSSYALDTILTEKNMLCEGNNIKIFHSIDSDLNLPFKDFETYSLFSNLLDNAIESALKEDVSKRVIKLYIKNKGDFLFIKEINYTSQIIKFKDGLPLTNKEDTINHGYGVKSIKSIIDKYAGSVTFNLNNSYFEVTILVPIANKENQIEEQN